MPRVTSNHGKAEAIYWDARHKANALRKTFPKSAFKSKHSNLTDIVRVWDFYAPDYNCPLLKERVGRSLGSPLHALATSSICDCVAAVKTPEQQRRSAYL